MLGLATPVMPAGTWSVILILLPLGLCESDGPRFVTVRFQVIVLPTTTPPAGIGFGEVTVLTSCRSASVVVLIGARLRLFCVS